MDEPQLTKREKRELARQRKREERVQGELKKKIQKFVIWVLIFGIIFGGGYWLWQQASKPLPGEAVPDIGTQHVTDISGVSYNSNPPTSGTHFPVWAKKGVYDRVISDGYLLHSLEHGYVVISYNCQIQNPKSKIQIFPDLTFEIWNWDLNVVSAHETDEPHEEPVITENAEESAESTEVARPLTRMTVQPQGATSWFTPDNPPEDEVGLADEFKSNECRDLVNKLSKFAKDWDRVIVVPRPNLDTRIALTAWGRIDKMDEFDEQRIKAFIKSFHNRGPEKTVE